MQSNVAKIADFGMSKVIQAGGKNTMMPGNIDFMPPEAHKAAGLGYNCSLDVFSFAGIILHTFTEQWPTPSNATEYDSKTRTLVAYTEIQRRMKYIELMTGEAGVMLRPLVEECLNMDPDARPSIATVQKRINNKYVSLDEDHISVCSVYLYCTLHGWIKGTKYATKFMSDTSFVEWHNAFCRCILLQ